MKLSAAIEAASAKFEQAGIESFQADAEILLGFVLGLSRGELQVKAITGEELNPDDELKFQDLVDRRAERFPCNTPEQTLTDMHQMPLWFKVT